MGRTRRRVSRVLIGVLGITIALGLVFWLNNSRNNKAEARAEEGVAAPVAPKASSAIKAEELSGKNAGATVAQTPSLPAPAGSTVSTPTVAATPVATPAKPVAVASAAGTPPAKSLTSPASAAPSASAAPAPTPVSAQPLVDAKAKLDAGQTLEARRILVAALDAGTLSLADVKAVKQLLNQINASVVFGQTRYAADDYGGTHKVASGETLGKIAANHDVTADLLLRINGIADARKLQAGKTIKVVKGPFHAVVDKSDFTLEIWLGSPGERGSLYVTSYPVGLGENDSTPTGAWIVKSGGKLKNPAYYSPRGEGVFEADDPKNPLGEYWIALEGVSGNALGAESYGIHGTIEPDTIGKQASLGCVRLLNEDVARVYELLVDGKSTVLVRD